MLLVKTRPWCLCFKRCSISRKAQQKEVLEKYFKASKEQLEPVYKEVIRLIYREEIPTK